MQVTREMQKLARKPGEIRARIRIRIRAILVRREHAYDRAEKLVETWDFGYWHGLFAAEEGYVPGQGRPEVVRPNRYSELMDEISARRANRPDWLTTGPIRQIAPFDHPIEGQGFKEPIPLDPQDQARQAEIDGYPGKAARLRGVSEAEARKVEAPAEKQARRNKAKIDREFASGKRMSLT